MLFAMCLWPNTSYMVRISLPSPLNICFGVFLCERKRARIGQIYQLAFFTLLRDTCAVGSVRLALLPAG